MRRKNIIVLVIMLVIGFASVSATLILNGVVGISSNQNDFSIIFTSVKLNGRKRNDFIDQETKQTINFETNKLTDLDETAVLDYEVTNTSRLYDGEVVISCEVPENEYVSVEYSPKSMKVFAGKTESGSITARLIKTSTEDGSIDIKCTLNASAVERDTLGEEYIEPFSRAGVLMAVPGSGDEKKFWAWRYIENITKVVFEDRMNVHETEEDLIFDVSENQDESVKAYLVANEDDDTKYTLYIQSESGVKANPDSSSLLSNFINLEEIEGLKYFDTSNITDMNGMFAECESLTKLNLSSFDTSNVTDMAAMFVDCFSLTKLDLSSFDTRNVTSIEFMFAGCSSLTELDLSNFDMSNITEYGINDMSFGCINLTSINLSNAVLCDGFSLAGLENLETVNLSNVDTSNITDMNGMFYGCSSLTTLNLSSFDTSNVTDMSAMFVDCFSLTKLDLSSFDTSNVTDMSGMFVSMPDNAIVKVKDADMQSLILTEDNGRPSEWTTDNVIIVG